MARRLPDKELKAITDAVRGQSTGMTLRQIANVLDSALPRRTLQYRLKSLVDKKQLVMEGEGRWTRYKLPGPAEMAGATATDDEGSRQDEPVIPLSYAGREIRAYLRQASATRKPVGYQRDFLESYRPNESFYLSQDERIRLGKMGLSNLEAQPAGTYAKQILNRLLIDLSWNSSRLEGNTYSLLDTRRLIEFGEQAGGHDRLEAQMILNHKDAIEFLIGAIDEIGFDRYTILNLHAILANNLLADESAAGRLRRIPVGIEKSVFYPLAVPQIIEECFDQILASAAAIEDPFEQAFFVMVQLPYLQPFDDVNKRVSRLSANIPFIKGNFSPLSFEGVPRDLYTQAVLAVYELNRVDLLRDVFIWAYERSAARYAAVRQSLGQPDPFKLKHRDSLRAIVAEIVRAGMDRKAASARIASWTQAHIDTSDRDQFREVVESELLSLHEGNFARYRIKPSEFRAWRKIWAR